MTQYMGEQRKFLLKKEERIIQIVSKKYITFLLLAGGHDVVKLAVIENNPNH